MPKEVLKDYPELATPEAEKPKSPGKESQKRYVHVFDEGDKVPETRLKTQKQLDSMFEIDIDPQNPDKGTVTFIDDPRARSKGVKLFNTFKSFLKFQTYPTNESELIVKNKGTVEKRGGEWVITNPIEVSFDREEVDAEIDKKEKDAGIDKKKEQIQQITDAKGIETIGNPGWTEALENWTGKKSLDELSDKELDKVVDILQKVKSPYFKEDENLNKPVAYTKDGRKLKRVRQGIHTRGIFTDGEKYYKSSMTRDDRMDAQETYQTQEYEILKDLQDIPGVIKVGDAIETDQGQMFEVEKLKPVKSITLDDYKRLQDVLDKIGERDIILQDNPEIMQRDDGSLVLIDFSDATRGKPDRQDNKLDYRIEQVYLSEKDQEALKAEREKQRHTRLADIKKRAQARKEKERKEALPDAENDAVKKNDLLSKIDAYNSLDLRQRKKNFQTANAIEVTAKELGFKAERTGSYIYTLYDQRGKKVKRTPVKMSQEEILSHPSLKDYPQEVQDFIQLAIRANPDFQNVYVPELSNSQKKQAFQNIQEGKKTVAANIMLDELQSFYHEGGVAVNATGGAGKHAGIEFIPIEEMEAWAKQLEEMDSPKEDKADELVADREIQDVVDDFASDGVINWKALQDKINEDPEYFTAFPFALNDRQLKVLSELVNSQLKTKEKDEPKPGKSEERVEKDDRVDRKDQEQKPTTDSKRDLQKTPKEKTPDHPELPDQPRQGSGHSTQRDRRDRIDRPAEKGGKPGLVYADKQNMPDHHPHVSPETYQVDADQLFGINHALTHLIDNDGKAFMLADGTGVGKTRQLLGIADQFQKLTGKKVMIITQNKQIIDNNFAKDAKAMGIDMGKFELGTYDNIRTGKVGKGEYGLILFDEAHNLKNPESLKTIAADNLVAEKRLFATATPMDTQRGAIYFISQVAGMRPEEVYAMLGLRVQRKRNNKGEIETEVTLAKGSNPQMVRNNLIRLRNAIIESGAMLRREYPFWGDIGESTLSMQADQLTEHEAIEDYWEDVEANAANEFGFVHPKKLKHIRGQRSNELSRWNEQWKINYVLDRVKKDMEAGKKVVVIAEGIHPTFIKGLDRMVPGFIGAFVKRLEADGYNVAKIYGAANKSEANLMFQRGDADIVVGTPQSASTGIDLDDQAGDDPRSLYMVTPNYSGNLVQQIMGRISRRNTKSPSEVNMVFNDSSSDTRRRAIVRNKMNVLRAIQDGRVAEEIDWAQNLKPDTPQPDKPSPEAIETPLTGELIIKDISPKAFVVVGDTKENKDALKQLEGKWHGKHKGWMFPATRKAEISKLLPNKGKRPDIDRDIDEIGNDLQEQQEMYPSPHREVATPDQRTIDRVIDRAIEEFGTTEDYKSAGYILPNGEMLHFGSPRMYDHRNIGAAFFEQPDSQGEEATIFSPRRYYTNKKWMGSSTPNMLAFMDMGNIRVMPETNGIDIHVRPTYEQITQIGRIAQKTDGEMILDLTDINGREASIEYDPGTSSQRIKTDIKNFYDKSIVPVKSKLPLGEETIPYTFYSPTEQALGQIKQAKGTPAQFKAMLLKNGAKQAELDWMGFDEFSQGKKSLTKQEIQQWINENKVEIQDINKENVLVETLAKSMREIESEFNDNEYGYTIEKTMSNDVVVLDRDGEIVSGVSPSGEAMDQELPDGRLQNLSDKYYDLFEQLEIAESDTETDYEKYQLPGGSNYGEFLLTMPGSPQYEIVERESNVGGTYFIVKNKVTGKSVPGTFTTRSEAGYSMKRFNNIEHSNNFQSSHWEEPNIVAHARIKDYTDTEGRKLLHLEEIQSDWAQQGKKKGFKKPSGKTFKELGIEADKLRDKIRSSKDAKEKEDLRNKLDEIEQERSDLENDGIIPDMPFKQTPQWVNLVLRRMAVHAAENGYDGISWTPGELQAKRYDLSKQLDAITTNEVGSNNKKPVVISFKDKYDDLLLYVDATSGEIKESVAQPDWEGKGLDEAIGKEMSEKVMSTTETKEFTGLDLKVGGEGIINFYDKIVPIQANKIFKKYGAQVGEITIQAGIDKLKVPYLPITDKLSRMAMEVGFPLFEKTQPYDYSKDFRTFENSLTDNARKHLTVAYGSIQKAYDNLNKTVRQTKGKNLSPRNVRKADDRRPSPLWDPEKFKERTVLKDFKEQGYIDFRKQRIRTAQDVVDLFHVFRSPLIEKSHAIFERHGEIVENYAVTANNPTGSYMFPANWMHKVGKQLGATGVYIMHNHPSGDHKPSTQDVYSTIDIAQRINTLNEGDNNPMEFRGHMVINDKKYTFMGYKNGELISDEYEYKGGKALFTPRMNFTTFGINQMDTKAKIAKEILEKANYPAVMVHLNNILDVTGYSVIPKGVTTEDIEKMVDNGETAHGSKRYIVVHDGSLSRQRLVFPEGILEMIDTGKQTSNTDYITAPRRKQYPQMQLWEDIKEYGKGGERADLIEQVKQFVKKHMDQYDEKRIVDDLHDAFGNKFSRTYLNHLYRTVKYESEKKRLFSDKTPKYSLDKTNIPVISQFIREDIMPGLQKAGKTISELHDGIIRRLAPKTYADIDTVDIIFEMLGDRNKEQFLLESALRKYHTMFRKMKPADRIDFIDKIKRGEQQPSKELQDVADFIRDLDNDLYERLSEYAPGLPWLENHFRVLWKTIPGSFRKKWYSQRRPLEGAKGFMKKATLMDISEGIDMGGVPVTTNPIEMYERAYADAMKFITARRMWENLAEMGKIKFVRKRQDPPEDFETLNDKISKVYFRTNEGLFAEPGEYYVSKDAARMLNNHLSTDYIRKYQIGRGALAIKNLWTMVELGLNLFHFTFETFEIMSSNMGTAGRRIVNLGIGKGDPKEIIKGLVELIETPIAPASVAVSGHRAIQYLTQDEFRKSQVGEKFMKKYPEVKTLLDDLFYGGGKLEMYNDYRVNAIGSFREALKKENYLGAALRILPAFFQLTMKPLFEYYIPRLKVGLFLKEYSLALVENHNRIMSGEITRGKLARQTWNFVEDRLGEMNFDNLFWDKTFKTSMQVMFRSTTWKLGNFRGMGTAPIEQALEFRQAIRNKRKPLLKPKISWVFALLAFQSVMATIIQYMMTGKFPETLRDLIVPQINPDDEDERLVLPTYVKDMFHFYHSPGTFVRSSMSGTISRGLETIYNEDYYGYEIYDIYAPWHTKFAQGAEHMIPEPFSISSYQRMRKAGEPVVKSLGSFMGFLKAPKYIVNEPIENDIHDLFMMRNASIKPYGASKARERMWEIEQLWEKEEIAEAEKLYQEGVEEGILDDSKTKTLAKRINTKLLGKEDEAFRYMFRTLPIQDKIHLFSKMNDKQKEYYDPKGTIEARILDREFFKDTHPELSEYVDEASYKMGKKDFKEDWTHGKLANNVKLIQKKDNDSLRAEIFYMMYEDMNQQEREYFTTLCRRNKIFTPDVKLKLKSMDEELNILPMHVKNPYKKTKPGNH